MKGSGFVEDVFPSVAQGMIAGGVATKYEPANTDKIRHAGLETAAIAPVQETAMLRPPVFKRGPSSAALRANR